MMNDRPKTNVRSFIHHSSFIIHHFLSRHWFLLVLVAGVSVTGARPDWVQPGTEKLPARGVVGVSLFLMAWGLDSRSLFAAVVRPWPALWAALLSYTAVPGLAWLAGSLLSEPDYRVGLLVIASVPCTLASAVLWTRLAGGSEATALLVILLTTATSWLATTAWLALAAGVTAGLDAGGMMRELTVVLVLPVGLGQLARTAPALARAAQRGRTFLSIVSRLLIFSIIVKATADVASRLGAGTDLPAPGPLLATAGLCLAVHLAALAGGLCSSKALHFDRPSQTAVAFACSQKTLPVALLLFETYFKDAHPLAVLPMVFYHVGQLVVDTFIAERLALANRG